MIFGLSQTPEAEKVHFESRAGPIQVKLKEEFVNRVQASRGQ